MTATDAPLEWLSTAPRLPGGDGTPAHAAIARWLGDLIGRGELVAGDRLPREDRFAALLGVSRMTLRQALASLEGKGALERRTGRHGGTFVREPRIECDLTGLAGFTEQMRRANVRAGARVVSARTVPAGGSVSSGLSVPRGSPVHEIVRVRTARREPLAIERSWFPAGVLPDLLSRRLTGSLYQMLARVYGLAPVSAVEALQPVIARDEEAALLKVDPGGPLMLIERTASAASGLAVEFARDLFRPDRIKISLRTALGEPATFRSALAAVGAPPGEASHSGVT